MQWAGVPNRVYSNLLNFHSEISSEPTFKDGEVILFVISDKFQNHPRATSVCVEEIPVSK